MKELDQLLTAYLDLRYDSADDAEKSAFEALLGLPDPELVGYLLKRESPGSEAIARVIANILDIAHA